MKIYKNLALLYIALKIRLKNFIMNANVLILIRESERWYKMNTPFFSSSCYQAEIYLNYLRGKINNSCFRNAFLECYLANILLSKQKHVCKYLQTLRVNNLKSIIKNKTCLFRHFLVKI